MCTRARDGEICSERRKLNVTYSSQHCNGNGNYINPVFFRVSEQYKETLQWRFFPKVPSNDNLFLSLRSARTYTMMPPSASMPTFLGQQAHLPHWQFQVQKRCPCLLWVLSKGQWRDMSQGSGIFQHLQHLEQIIKNLFPWIKTAKGKAIWIGPGQWNFPELHLTEINPYNFWLLILEICTFCITE